MVLGNLLSLIVFQLILSLCGCADANSCEAVAPINPTTPYRVIVNALDRGNADKLLFETFAVPSTTNGDELDVNSVLIAVKAAGVNYIDTYHRSGLYPGVTQIGLEGSGVITMIGGNVTNYQVDDSVFWFSIPGSYATHLVVNENTLSLSKFTTNMLQMIAAHAQNTGSDPLFVYKFGASIGIQALTAHYLTHSITRFGQETSVLVHSGAGGTGNLLLQILKNVLGVKLVITTVGNENKRRVAEIAGADHVIVGYDSFEEQVMQFTANRGVDVVIDGVGAKTWKQSLRCLKQRGWCIYFGNASGKMPNVDLLELTQQGSVIVTRPSLRHFVRNAQEIRQRYSDIFSWVKNGTLKINIGHELKLSQAKQAHAMLEARQTVNKIILIN